MMRVRGLSHALPASVADAAEVAAWTGADASFIADKVGFTQRRFLAADEPPSALAAEALNNLFERFPALDRDEVDALFVVTQTPDYSIPHMAAQLQPLCSLPDSVAALDISLGCSGWVYGLSVLRAAMQAENWRNAVLVTCDPYSKIMSRSDRATVTVFGDAAAATWLSPEAGATVGATDFGTDGRGAEGLILRAGRGADPVTSIHQTDIAGDRAGRQLYMDGRAILTFMLDRVPASVERCLAKNALRMEDVDVFVFHQASRYMIELLRRRLDLAEEQAPFLLGDIGNCVSSTIPIALERLQSRTGLAGKTVLVSGFGVGLSWATTILKF
jgi:3-oxoacyl-[acyl-carrier-protein] synthase-3